MVRWGEAPGRLTEQTEQDHKLVYEYVYGPGERILFMMGLKWPMGDLSRNVLLRTAVCAAIAVQHGQQRQPLRHARFFLADPAVMSNLCPGSAEQGDTTYQSPILHHVLLRDLKPGATIHYSVGERRWC